MAYSKTFLLLSLILVFTLLISSEVYASRQLNDHTVDESFQYGNPKVGRGSDPSKGCRNSPAYGCHNNHHGGHGGHGGRGGDHPEANTETNGN